MTGVTRFPALACRVCGKQNDAASFTGTKGARPRAPRAGDFAICIGCGAIGVYVDATGTIREPSDEERAEALARPGVTEAILFIKSKRGR